MTGQAEFTDSELEAVTMVFKQYETGVREACINVKDLLPALVSLGLNMMEQEVIDMTNTIAKDGLVFFPEFSQVVLKKFREDDESEFAEMMFKMLCGTEPFPELYRAKKYKIHQKFLSKTEFHFIMKNLPVPVSDRDIEEMFLVADTNNDGKISFSEFKAMVNPPKPPEMPKPTKAELQSLFYTPSSSSYAREQRGPAPATPARCERPPSVCDINSFSLEASASNTDPLLHSSY